MATTDTATITNVTLVTDGKLQHDDTFTITLSANGIEVRRPDQASAHLAWSRVAQWQIEEDQTGLVLTLRGGGATTPLAIRGWSLPDLDALMRRFTGHSATLATTPRGDAESAHSMAQTKSDGRPPGVVDLLGTASHSQPPVATAALRPVVDPGADAEGRPAEEALATAPGGRWLERMTPKAAIAVALLGLFALAVTIVLLQSAGIITWSFLGPTS
jgi:hypothetical protein